jgi:transposase
MNRYDLQRLSKENPDWSCAEVSASRVFSYLEWELSLIFGDGLPDRAAASWVWWPSGFGVSASSAIRWLDRLKQQGDIAAKKQGGDRKSGRIEAEAAFLLGEVAETPDITLVELQEKLKTRGVGVRGKGCVWRLRQPGQWSVFPFWGPIRCPADMSPIARWGFGLESLS